MVTFLLLVFLSWITCEVLVSLLNDNDKITCFKQTQQYFIIRFKLLAISFGS